MLDKKKGTYTPEEIAKYLRAHPYTVKRLTRQGKIPGFSAILYGGFASGEKIGNQCRLMQKK